MTRGSSVLLFSLTDSEGFTEYQYRHLAALTSHLKKDNEFMTTLPPIFIQSYHFHKAGLKSWEDMASCPATLKPGTYTIGISALFNKETEDKIQTELTIRVE
ncbi:hypothetical protein [Paenibacillus piri]|uniref:Uncharacterized protein n=1 Tax=Paenibacillus piri TaxID=2547395 RepID=A0A4R5KKU7_9BACL|nr:hypothetical protein [Paenibacillus piri]TDF95050.1 hypothetical protein E1757_21160 [Paenibacillus piri]